MSWLDTIKGRAQEAKSKAPEARAPEARPAKPRAKREIKVAWFQTAAPRDGDAGAVELVHYFVADGVVTLCDENGKSTKRTAILADGDDPGRIAARMGRKAWQASGAANDFNRRLTYGPAGVA
ncbi:hypothetical protein ABH973_006244 [Bradyrhizobium ottawaense]|uniref:hypothetical protein n=1 Tax=Bradyrhizobium ottawaense TaxID=931866 RepID=UPI003514D890